MLSGRFVNHKNWGIGELLLNVMLATSVSAVFYYCYYLLAPWIWSQNIAFNPGDLTPWMLEAAEERDGIEIYALYTLMLINSFAALIISMLAGGCARKYCRIIIGLFCSAITLVYCVKVGFTPPMFSLENTRLLDLAKYSSFIIPTLFLTLWCLYKLEGVSVRLMLVVTAILLLPFCFVTTGQVLWIDYTYIFAPALRLLNGAAINNIYFQYDLLPSLLAATWMKLGLDLNLFQILGLTAYYVAISGVFLLARKLFCNRMLPLLLLAALVIGRLYATPHTTVQCFQVTPLRLDLWLPLLFTLYYLGPYHWGVGLVCGLLILLAKNFGIIYSLAYLQLLLTLFIINHFDNKAEQRDFFSSLVAYCRRCLISLAIIISAGILNYFIFNNSEYGNYASYFQKIGFGFIQISQNSFYWFIPPVFGVVLILIWKLRKVLSATYISTGLMLLFCAIGNSIYFFGRSHEHNILNIAIVLLFIFFLMLDLITRFLKEDSTPGLPFWHRHFAAGVAAIFISVMIIFYSDNIAKKMLIQASNIKQGRLVYAPHFDYYSLQRALEVIRTVTAGSKKVYFVTSTDFNLYYYGGYAPVGYCNPFPTWIFVSSIRPFLQTLLDDGYYLICSPELQYMLTGLSYNYNLKLGSSVVVAKKPR